MVDWAKVAFASISALGALFRWLADKQMIDAATAAAVAGRMEKEAHALREANAIRERVARELADDPSRLREDDGFKRKPNAAPADEGGKPPVL